MFIINYQRENVYYINVDQENNFHLQKYNFRISRNIPNMWFPVKLKNINMAKRTFDKTNDPEEAVYGYLHNISDIRTSRIDNRYF